MNPQKSILVVDDEESICLAFRRFFERRQWQVHVAPSCAKGLEMYRQFRPDVVFLDVRLADGDGLKVLERLRMDDPQASVIIITAYGSLEVVMRAMRGQAFAFMSKPLDLDKAVELADRVIASRLQMATAPEGSSAGSTAIVGTSPVMQEVYKRIALVAQSDAAVLILGPTGTGKDLVARTIHQHSARRDKPFVAINCGALPENLVESELFGHVRGAFTGADADRPGRFESANGGTVFLDEVGELPPPAQVKLLRVLDSHALERLGSTRSIDLDVRVLAATNRKLAADVESGRFRADLYYRLAVMQIELPPLAERREDILMLARHFLSPGAGPGQAAPLISPEAAYALERYSWPGNVRELKNALEHATALARSRPILPADLPEQVRTGVRSDEPPRRLQQMVQEYLASLPEGERDLYRQTIHITERALIEHALARTGGNQSEAAALLGLHRNTLRTKLNDLGIKSDETR
jgi:two-component system nitrogen regulation response regulator GlnG